MVAQLAAFYVFVVVFVVVTEGRWLFAFDHDSTTEFQFYRRHATPIALHFQHDDDAATEALLPHSLVAFSNTFSDTFVNSR